MKLLKFLLLGELIGLAVMMAASVWGWLGLRRLG